ncbi:MAG: hypothetical protein WD063_09195 [Pirellulales bacterium]
MTAAEPPSGRLTLVDDSGFGEESNVGVTRIRACGDCLYLGTWNTKRGGRLYRSTDGKTWQPLSDFGFGNPNNFTVQFIAPFAGRLYVSTWNWTQGLEVWRATLGDAVPFADWDKVASGGFDDRRQIMTTSLLVADGALYVGTIGTFNLTGGFFSPTVKVNSATGGVLMTSRDGRSWRRIDAPGFMVFPQIGIEWLEAFQGKIYIGSQALDHPSQLWVYEPPRRG